MGFKGTRRDLIRVGVGLLAAPSGWGIARGQAVKGRDFNLTETAGLRRYGFPVHIIMPGFGDESRFRLTRRSGRPVPAQFRAVDEGGERRLALDFNASPGPFEVEDYRVEPGIAGPEPTSGLTVEQGGSGGPIRVGIGPDLRYSFSTAPEGLLDSVDTGQLGYLAGPGMGFRLRDKAGQKIVLGQAGPPGFAVVRKGPFAVVLRKQFTSPMFSASSVEVTVPRSKSWVEISWTIADFERRIGSLSFGADLKVEATPTLIDFGAAGTVYGQIQGDDSMALLTGGAGAPWSVMRERAGRHEVIATARTGSDSRAEGWAHVMDRSRCVAIAVADLGRDSEDSLIVQAGGGFAISRRYIGAPPVRPQLKFWMHFVGMPVQVGALTSPQAMMAPLRFDRMP